MVLVLWERSDWGTIAAQTLSATSLELPSGHLVLVGWGPRSSLWS